LDINGTALNTAIAIEIIQKDGTSFPNPVVINLPNAGVTVDNNGSRIQVSANVIPYNDADGHAIDQQRKFKVYNVIGNHTYSTAFNVNVQPEVTGIGAFGGDNAFNRHQISGDDVTIDGTGLLAVTQIEIVDENGTALTNTPKIVLPHPGVVVTDTSISIDTQTAQFANASSGDSLRNNIYRRFKLTSSRNTKYTAQASRFTVGVPPTYTSFSGLSMAMAAGNNKIPAYRRDNDNITFNGSGLGLLSAVQIVDVNGNPIPGVTDASDQTGVTSVTSSSFQLDSNASAFTGQGHLLDSSTLLSDFNGTRRIRVITPFGILTTPMSSAFTISALPDFLPINANTASNTFAGSADFNGTDYNATRGLLIVNGSNFRGVKRLYFGDNSLNQLSDWMASGNSTGPNYLSIGYAIDPNAMPAGITINAAGTQMSFTKVAINDINATWLGGSNRAILFLGAADQNATTPLIKANN
jgi:hypothetical protein